MLRVSLSSATWGDVKRVLARHALTYDEKLRVYHAITGHDLLYSVVGAGAHCESGLPAPPDTAAHYDWVASFWLVLPEKDKDGTLMAYERLAACAFDFIRLGNLVEDANGNVLNSEQLEEWQRFLEPNYPLALV